MHKLFMIMVLIFVTLPVKAINCPEEYGTIIKGAVNGKDYCWGKKNSNWWNAISWCEGLGLTPINRQEDCGCSNTIADCINKCPNFSGLGASNQKFWLNDVPNKSQGYIVQLSGGAILTGDRSTVGQHEFPACK